MKQPNTSAHEDSPTYQPCPVQIGEARPLFQWDDVDPLSDFHRLKLALDILPDEQILIALENKRGHGRNDYPVTAMWRAYIAGIVFQHPSTESLVRELKRNKDLLSICGFDPLPRQAKPCRRVVDDPDKGAVIEMLPAPLYGSVPNGWNFSRFYQQVEEVDKETGLVSEMMETLREELKELLPDFAERMGYDGKAIDSHSTGQVKRETGKTSDPDADWGKHETVSVDAQGKKRTKTKTWFGYRLHLIADTTHELPMSFEITSASVSEQKVLPEMIRELYGQDPVLKHRAREFSADRGLDSGPLKQMLWDEYQIRPLIDTRALWSEEKKAPDYDPQQPIRRLLDPEKTDNILYSEKGNVFCRCPQTGEEREMLFYGNEARRNTLKYRCPAAAGGFECQGWEACHRQAGSKAGDYGRIVRIQLDKVDRRIFTPTPHGSPTWKRGYNRRSALERINARLDNDFGFERHYLRGLTRMRTRVGLALTVMMSLAVGHIRAGRPEQMRSLVGAIPLADTG